MTFALLAAALTLLAPPATAAPPAPVLLELRPDADGRVFVAVTEVLAVTTQHVETETVDGQRIRNTKTLTRVVPVTATVDLTTYKGLTVTTAGGKKVEAADALKAMGGGVVVVASADGQPVDAKFLKMLDAGVLVVTGKALTEAEWSETPAPYLLELSTDAKGEFVRSMIRYEILGGSASIPIPMLAHETYTANDLSATTAGGKPVAPADAAKAYAAGATVVVSADGRPVDAKFLKLFKADVLVLTFKVLPRAAPAIPKATLNPWFSNKPAPPWYSNKPAPK